MSISEVKERQHLTDHEIVKLGNMAAKSFGEAKAIICHTTFNGSYVNRPERWNIGYQSRTAAAAANGLVFVIGDNEGMALCYPPGASYDRSLADVFGQKDADAEKAEPEFCQFFKEKHMPTENAISKSAWPNDEKVSALYVGELAVAVGSQGRGYGTALTRAITDKAMELKADVIMDADNERNVKMYQRHGFQLVQTGRMPIYGSEETFGRYCMRWQHDQARE